MRTFTCSRDASHTRVETIPALGHAWDAGVVTTAPTCEVPGVRTFTCTRDASHVRTEAVPAFGHAWDAGVVTIAPTSTAPGVRTFTCAHDATHIRTEAIPATGTDPAPGPGSDTPDPAPGTDVPAPGTDPGTNPESGPGSDTPVPGADPDPGAAPMPDADPASDPASGPDPAPGADPAVGPDPKGGQESSSTAKVGRAKNPITIKAKSPFLKVSKLKKASRTIAAKNAFTVRKAKGAVTYLKMSGHRKIVLSLTGKVTVGKGVKKGTYRIKALVYAKGNARYKPGGKLVTLKVRVGS